MGSSYLNLKFSRLLQKIEILLSKIVIARCVSFRYNKKNKTIIEDIFL